jgi:hypothetical protein
VAEAEATGGAAVSVSGSGFAPGVSVSIRVVNGGLLRNVTPDAAGAFTTTVTLPVGPAADMMLQAISSSGHHEVARVRRLPVASLPATSGGPGYELSVSTSEFRNELIDVYQDFGYHSTIDASAGPTTTTLRLSPRPNGTTTLTFRGRTSGLVVDVPFEVVGALNVSPTVVAVGDAFAVTGSGYAPGETVELTVEGAAAGSLVADGTGAIAGPIDMPAGVPRGVVLRASGATSKVARDFHLTRLAAVNVDVEPAGPGRLVTISGSGFLSGEFVTMDLDGQPVGPSVRADTNGQVVATRNLPAFADGAHVLHLIGIGSDAVATRTIHIEGSLVASPNGGAAGAAIPVAATGFGPSETVDVYLGGSLVGAVTSGAGGEVTTSFTMPGGGLARPIGLRLIGATSGVRRTVQLVRL